MAMMADCVGFQAQIASIIEMLANSAVVEICKLVDDGYASLRSQMDQEREQSEKENNVLRLKIRDMDIKIRSYERKMKRRNQREGMHSVQFRPPEVISAVMPLNEDLQTRGASHSTASDDPPFPQMPQEESHALALVKQEREERTDCNLDLKVEVNLRTEEPGEEASPSDRLDVLDSHTSTNQNSSPHSEATVDLTCRPRTKRKLSKSLEGSSTPGSSGNLTGVGLKPETQVDDTSDQQTSMQSAASTAEEPSPDRLNSLGLDLAWMQERVSHLGAAFAVAQLGLGSTETGHLSSSFPTQADNLEGPPTMLFPGGAHEMAAFAATFDMAAAANAAAAATAAASAPPPAPSNQRRPYRSNAAKEPMVCNVCGRTFPSSAALELHQRVHTGERPYSCQHCGKGFAQPNNLRVHLLIHSGERRYHCSLCGKSFISSSHLRRHRTVHTQEKPYSCARCGQSFSQLCSVRRHRQQSQCGL